ncbi:MAG: Nif3-like dinuclear metal center hexameric protein [Deltaproteobacteria bacterium]|jgi:dinuclear metal center YbgI/SA1388 family protein|nr:Nif3-like dinuclear metal center hexameric protein [Deltaproteobacteria bacterium]
MLVFDILKILEKIAPYSLALDWDNSGLQVGDINAEVKKLAISLDPTLSVMEEALKMGANLLVSHHPLIFKPLKNISFSDKSTEALVFAIKNNLNVVSFHTNYDASSMALALADTLELKVLEFLEDQSLKYLKLVVFVPPENASSLMDALFRAGAGVIEDYSKCSFSQDGTGSFQGDLGTKPSIGKSGELTFAKESRIEVVLPQHLKERVADAIIKNHPYEEPAYDFYEAQSPGKYGFGVLGIWDPPKEPREFIAEKLNLKSLSLAGPIALEVKKVALMPGSGGSYIELAKKKDAEILITGDLSHHQAILASDIGLGVISAGHFETENPGMLLLANHLQKTYGHRLSVSFIEGESPIRNWILKF